MARRKRVPPFVPIFRDVLWSDSWLDLSNGAKLVYIYIKSEYKGENNGKMTMPYSMLSKIMSTDTIKRKFNELIDKGWIEKTHSGGLYHNSNRYKLTLKYDRVL